MHFANHPLRQFLFNIFVCACVYILFLGQPHWNSLISNRSFQCRLIIYLFRFCSQPDSYVLIFQLMRYFCVWNIIIISDSLLFAFLATNHALCELYLRALRPFVESNVQANCIHIERDTNSELPHSKWTSEKIHILTTSIHAYGFFIHE